MGLQFIQLELILGKTPSRSFRPVKSAEIIWQMAATQTTNNNSIRSILEKEKLNGSNFLDWYRNLRIVLRNEQKLHHLEEALPKAPPATTTAAVRNAYTPRVAKQQEVSCLMLVSMTLKIQKNLEDRPAFEILQELKTMFQQQAEQELFETIRWTSWLHPMPLVLGVNMILTSLLKDYDQLVQNYNMHGIWKTIPELHAMLKLTEKVIPKKTPIVLTIGKVKSRNLNRKNESWGRTKPVHLAHQGLRGYQKLNKGALDLYVGNGHSCSFEAIKAFNLSSLVEWILVLDNVSFPLLLRWRECSLSRFWDKGFRNEFMDNGAILVSKDNICYFNDFPRDGIFDIDMHNHISKERSIYTCSNKKTKHNLDSTFLWHCHLGHINKKRIEKLQHDGLLESIDDESFDVCLSCISGKMARKPFTHASERADDLLGIIHSDVCG
ncbi:zinc finger, CCHC-type containing protein [Tanacetum coccineum]